MKLTRSQGDAADIEDRRRVQSLNRDQQRNTFFDRLRNIPSERPPSALADFYASKPEENSKERKQRSSPVKSRTSHRSSVSVKTRMRVAELEAAERLAAIRRHELELEANLVKMRLAAEVAAKTTTARMKNTRQSSFPKNHIRGWTIG